MSETPYQNPRHDQNPRNDQNPGHSEQAATSTGSSTLSRLADRLAAHAAPEAIRAGSQRAAFLWLRGRTDAGTARRAKSVWSQLCLGCHYHQYEIGPTQDQVRAWSTEVASIVRLLSD